MAIVLFAATSVAAAGRAEIIHRASIQARVNPVGLSHASETAWRRKLYSSNHPLLASAALETGMTTSLSPAAFAAGPYVECTPLAILKLRAQTAYTGYWGTFGHLAEFSEANPNWSPSTLASRADEGEGRAADGWIYEGRATLQAVAGQAVASLGATAMRIDMHTTQSYYEPVQDFLLAPTDEIRVFHGMAAWLFGEDFDHPFVLAGLRAEKYSTLGSDVHRTVFGPLVVWRLPKNLAGERPLFLNAILYRYFNDPYREGQWMAGTQFSTNWEWP